MEKLIILIVALIAGITNGSLHVVPASSKVQAGAAYLPPLPESTLDQSTQNNIGQSLPVNTQNVMSNLNSYTTSYKINHYNQNSFDKSSPIKSQSSYSRTYHNSYAAQPSGVGKNVGILPTQEPLPSLLPNTVQKQLSSTSSTTFPSFISNSIFDSSDNQETRDIFPSIVMVDNSMEVLTPSHNQTIFAAKLLASSLLQEVANTSSSIDELKGLEFDDMSKLNAKDMFILKATKNAYIVPDNLDNMEVQQLYNMRNKLENAYTVNQFIFIVKPEHINFLNKLV